MRAIVITVSNGIEPRYIRPRKQRSVVGGSHFRLFWRELLVKRLHLLHILPYNFLGRGRDLFGWIRRGIHVIFAMEDGREPGEGEVLGFLAWVELGLLEIVVFGC